MPAADFRRAVWEALDEEMERDQDVVFFGEDVARAGGVFQVSRGLLEKHGADRVFDTPISELALASAAFGAAATGLRPVVEIMFGDFMALCMDSIVNQAAKYWYVSNEQASIPLTVRSTVGAGGQFGAIHSQIPIAWFQAVSGLKIVGPSSPYDAKGLLKAAIRDGNPVLFFEHKRLYSVEGDIGGAEDVVPIGKASIARPGDDVTVVAAMTGVHDALRAADVLAEVGISVEVVDIRSFRPLDVETIVGSVRKTSRILVVEEGPITGGWSGQIIADVVEHALEDLDDASRLTTPDLPIPYSPTLEREFLPDVEKIVQAVEGRVGRRGESAQYS